MVFANLERKRTSLPEVEKSRAASEYAKERGRGREERRLGDGKRKKNVRGELRSSFLPFTLSLSLSLSLFFRRCLDERELARSLTRSRARARI